MGFLKANVPNRAVLYGIGPLFHAHGLPPGLRLRLRSL